MSNKAYLILTTIFGTLFLVTVIALVLIINGNITLQTNSRHDIQEQKATSTDNSLPVTQHNIKNPSVQWLDKYVLFVPQTKPPIRIPQDWQKNPENDVKYYKLGRDVGRQGDIVLAKFLLTGMGLTNGYAIFLFKDNGDKMLILRNSNPNTVLLDKKNTYDPKLYDYVKVDRDIVYKDISVQESIVLNNSDSLVTYDHTPLIIEYYEGLRYQTTKDGLNRMIKPNRKDGSLFHLEDIVKPMPASTGVIYQSKFSFMSDDMVPNIRWVDGTVNTSHYRNDGVNSCGAFGSVAVVDDGQIAPSDLEVVGYTSNGEPVYKFIDMNNPLPKSLYDAFGGEYYDYNEQTHTGKMKRLTLNEWDQKHGLFLYKDYFGRYIIFINTTYGPAAECGKPVIYLYPNQTTKVNVKVNAAITKSEPTYNPESGWIGVLAEPSGALIYNSKKYDSLFWEGVGIGAYPDTKQIGTVVKRQNVAQVLSEQLTELGLNNKEKTDFLEFWLPKMPDSPYVRLTWLGTKDMNKLAPLTISPNPDTVIRIFLDFEGLNKPIKIKPQPLYKVPRKGFTVVEWGGLLRK